MMVNPTINRKIKRNYIVFVDQVPAELDWYPVDDLDGWDEAETKETSHEASSGGNPLSQGRLWAALVLWIWESVQAFDKLSRQKFISTKDSCLPK